jgi:hypothetical protein
MIADHAGAARELRTVPGGRSVASRRRIHARAIVEYVYFLTAGRHITGVLLIIVTEYRARVSAT